MMINLLRQTSYISNRSGSQLNDNPVIQAAVLSPRWQQTTASGLQQNQSSVSGRKSQGREILFRGDYKNVDLEDGSAKKEKRLYKSFRDR